MSVPWPYGCLSRFREMTDFTFGVHGRYPASLPVESFSSRLWQDYLYGNCLMSMKDAEERWKASDDDTTMGKGPTKPWKTFSQEVRSTGGNS